MKKLLLFQSPELPAAPVEDSLPSFNLSTFLCSRRSEYLAGVKTRVEAIASQGDCLRVCDVMALVGDAFATGGAVMADGVSAQENLKRLAELDEAARAEEQRQRQAARRGAMSVIAWAEERLAF